RAGSTLYRGDGLRQTMVAIVADAEMTEHDSPAEAFIHVLEGQVTIHGDNRQWQISAGNLFPIPPEKHSVTAYQNSVFTLTVLRKCSRHRRIRCADNTARPRDTALYPMWGGWLNKKRGGNPSKATTPQTGGPVTNQRGAPTLLNKVRQCPTLP